MTNLQQKTFHKLKFDNLLKFVRTPIKKSLIQNDDIEKKKIHCNLSMGHNLDH